MSFSLEMLKSAAVKPLRPFVEYPKERMGGSSMGLLFARDQYVAEYGFVLLTQECVDALAGVLSGKRALEVGAGTGFLSHCLAEKGVSIVAQDVARPGDNFYGFQKTWKLDKIGPFEDSVTPEYDAIILSWPCLGSSFAFEVASAMSSGQILIYQGEGPGGCTAADDFFDYTGGEGWLVREDDTNRLNEFHYRFPAINDHWLVLEKR